MLQLLDDKNLQDSNISAQINKFHQNTGALLARRWNLHPAVYAAIRHYDKPEQAEEHRLTTQIVHLSHNLTQDTGWVESCKAHCADIDFEALHIDALIENLPLVDEQSGAAFSS